MTYETGYPHCFCMAFRERLLRNLTIYVTKGLLINNQFVPFDKFGTKLSVTMPPPVPFCKHSISFISSRSGNYMAHYCWGLP
jgi:hypothetical protein